MSNIVFCHCYVHCKSGTAKSSRESLHNNVMGVSVSSIVEGRQVDAYQRLLCLRRVLTVDMAPGLRTKSAPERQADNQQDNAYLSISFDASQQANNAARADDRTHLM